MAVTRRGVITRRNILTFAAVAEIGTGLALIVDPPLVVALLFGWTASDQGVQLGRVTGIALLALGMACWPSRERAESLRAAFRGMLVYSALAALYLAFLGAVGHRGGVLLWPAVTLHTALSLFLVWTWRTEAGAGERG